MGFWSKLSSLFFGDSSDNNDVNKVLSNELTTRIAQFNSRLKEVRKVKVQIFGGTSLSNKINDIDVDSRDYSRYISLLPQIRSLHEEASQLLDIIAKNKRMLSISDLTIAELRRSKIELSQDLNIINRSKKAA